MTTAQQRILYYLTTATLSYAEAEVLLKTLTWDWLPNFTPVQLHNLRLRNTFTPLKSVPGLFTKPLAISTNRSHVFSMYGGLGYESARSKSVGFSVRNWGYHTVVAPVTNANYNNMIEFTDSFDPEQRKLLAMILVKEGSRRYINDEMLKLLKLSLESTNPTTIIRGPIKDDDRMSTYRYKTVSETLRRLGYIYSCARHMNELPSVRNEVTTDAGLYGFHSKIKHDETFFNCDLTTLLLDSKNLIISDEDDLYVKAKLLPDACFLTREQTIHWAELDKLFHKTMRDAAFEHIIEESRERAKFLNIKDE